MSRNRKKLAKIGIPDDKKIILTDSVINKKEHPEINFKYLYKYISWKINNYFYKV